MAYELGAWYLVAAPREVISVLQTGAYFLLSPPECPTCWAGAAPTGRAAFARPSGPTSTLVTRKAQRDFIVCRIVAHGWPIREVSFLCEMLGHDLLYGLEASVFFEFSGLGSLALVSSAVIDYHGTFRFSVPPEVVWDAIGRTDEFQRWWSWLGEFSLVGDGLQSGSVLTGVVSPPLPYRMRLRIELEDCVRPWSSTPPSTATSKAAPA
ncbi:MAG: hypothetical protein M3083_00855 [Actinomycetota bacterium]|nr:hypothetical protein [Actinomycetota bacterium]